MFWPGKALKLTYSEFCTTSFTTKFEGIEIVGLYTALLHDEEALNHNQLKTLDSLRTILYENLSIEELERIALRASPLPGGRDNR